MLILQGVGMSYTSNSVQEHKSCNFHWNKILQLQHPFFPMRLYDVPILKADKNSKITRSSVTCAGGTPVGLERFFQCHYLSHLGPSWLHRCAPKKGPEITGISIISFQPQENSAGLREAIGLVGECWRDFLEMGVDK